MSTKDWQVGPTLKDKPGSQGTLFRGGTKYSSDKRYPRGYSPERGHAVNDAFRYNVYSSEDLDDHSYRRIVDTIARSTVPIEHLAPRKNLYATEYPIEVQSHHGVLPKGTHGQYSYLPHDVDVHNFHDKLAIQPYATGGSTVIHELGHHVSAMQLQPHSAPEGLHMKGREEAFADDYAHEHYRDRKGRAPGMDEYPALTNPGKPVPQEWSEGYFEQRKTTPANWTREWARQRPLSPTQFGQGTLF